MLLLMILYQEEMTMGIVSSLPPFYEVSSLNTPGVYPAGAAGQESQVQFALPFAANLSGQAACFDLN